MLKNLFNRKEQVNNANIPWHKKFETNYSKFKDSNLDTDKYNYANKFKLRKENIPSKIMNNNNNAKVQNIGQSNSIYSEQVDDRFKKQRKKLDMKFQPVPTIVT